MEQRRSGSTQRNPLKRAAISALALLPPAGTVRAAEVKFPQAKPVVALDVPDDWTIDKAKDLDMRSPDKKAIVVGDIIKKDKSKLDAWSKAAAEKLKSFGIAFDPKAKAPPPQAKAPPPKTVEAPSAFTTRPDAFTFSGKPSLAAPGTELTNAAKAGPGSLEALTSKDTTAAKTPPMPKLPFHAVQYYGTTLNGQPVDVQLLVYTLPDKRLFVMMQESGADDGRTVAIARSVKGVRTTPKPPSDD